MEEQNAEESLLQEFVEAADRANGAPEDTAGATGAAEETAEEQIGGETESQSANAEGEAEDPNPEDETSASSRESNANEGTNAPAQTAKPKYSNRKMKKLNHERYELQNRVTELERIIREMRAPAQEPKNEPPETKESLEEKLAKMKPVKTNFATTDEYYEALTAWNAFALDAKRQFALQSATREDEEGKAFAREWNRRLQNSLTKEEFEEYKALWPSHTPIGESVGKSVTDYVYNLEDGPKVELYLWKHPKACARLKNAHPFEQAEMLRNIRSFVGRRQNNNSAAKQVINQPKPFGSARTGGAKAQPVNIDSASAGQLFDMLAAGH